ncbi:MAG: hypothetical protein ACRCZB_10495 [Bacteroidales bacterium]
MSDCRKAESNGNSTSSPQESTYKFKKQQTMKRWSKISIISVVAILGAIITRTNILYWLVGLSVGKTFIRIILTASLAIILFVAIYALIVVSLFWILIS